MDEVKITDGIVDTCQDAEGLYVPKLFHLQTAVQIMDIECKIMDDNVAGSRGSDCEGAKQARTGFHS